MNVIIYLAHHLSGARTRKMILPVCMCVLPSIVCVREQLFIIVVLSGTRPSRGPPPLLPLLYPVELHPHSVYGAV